MKKKVIRASLAVLLVIIGSGFAFKYYQAKNHTDNQVDYVQAPKKSQPSPQKADADKTPDAINKEEGISAEQIVVKLTDKGYVTSHGDHYHYYNGKVPYDALISEDLIINDPNYAFNQTDVITDVKDGYIIKTNGSYYLYLKADSKRQNIRTPEEIAEQAAKGTKEAHS
ncbi:pneumococcal-type histidine triad protein [Streptococcus halichoeri]|uniref:pneumococcal-type histidine triad protein n=1 Tax=Streptococcus halichoeri TaxID=254785 RepID=UPI00135B4BFC|nr:pneumococcal-type histidine triad protein [Streptococcus halichoeri]